MLRRPPQHRANAEIVYVFPGDDAWDRDRIETEIADMEREEKGSGLRHPYRLYTSGVSRFDIGARFSFRDGAASALDYLERPKAWLFKLRRLNARELAQIQDRIHGKDHEACRSEWIDCAKWCLLEIEGPEAPKVLRSGGRVSEDTLDDLSSLGPDILYMVGFAAFNASLPLTEAEKKAFAS